MFYFKTLEKEEQTKPKASRRKKIIKTRVEINKPETRKIMKKINKTKIGSSKQKIKLTNFSWNDKQKKRLK